MHSLWHALITEFLGTLILTLVVCMASVLTVQQGGSVLGTSLAYGLAYVTLIYVFGGYSGAHFNPAISFGYAVAGRMNWLLMIGYWVAQVLGAITAGGLLYWIYGPGNTDYGVTTGSLTYSNPWKAFLVETIITFILVWCVLMITRNAMVAIMSGVAIGIVLTFLSLGAYSLTGASMNPARSLGPAIPFNNSNVWSTLWIPIVGPLLGALLAALIYRLFVQDWNCKPKKDCEGNDVRDDCGNRIMTCKRELKDKCGKTIKGDCEKAMVEEYEKVEKKYHHWQESPLSVVNDWLTSHGLAPEYLQHELQSVIPDYLLKHPAESLHAATQAIGPAAAVGSAALAAGAPVSVAADAAATAGVGALAARGGQAFQLPAAANQAVGTLSTPNAIGQLNQPNAFQNVAQVGNQLNPAALNPASLNQSALNPSAALNQSALNPQNLYQNASQLGSQFASQVNTPGVVGAQQPLSALRPQAAQLMSSPAQAVNQASNAALGLVRG